MTPGASPLKMGAARVLHHLERIQMKHRQGKLLETGDRVTWMHCCNSKDAHVTEQRQHLRLTLDNPRQMQRSMRSTRL